MTFDESLTWLNSTQFFGIKLGLDNTRRLLDHLGNPDRHARIFHVAGTNGKGSVCAMLDSILRAEGLRSGLYTSPHLCDFRERARVNGNMISKEATAELLTRLQDLCKDWAHSPTFFELTTALALAHFAREECDAVILETGMGGRLDATNATTPVVSIITPIAMDHAEWLGDSISEIAAEKAGIIKPGIPAVSAPQTPEAAGVLRAKASGCGSPLTFVEHPHAGDVGLEGAHQKWNASLAVSAIQASGFSPKNAAVVGGLRDVRWPARFHRVGDRIILDGAHNPHATTTLVETWREHFGSQNPSIIFGAMKDKDCREMLAILSKIAASFFFVPVASPRTAAPEELLRTAKCPGKIFPSLPAAIDSAMTEAPPILITGSLFLAGEALATFARKNSPDPLPNKSLMRCNCSGGILLQDAPS
ncbi:MAG: folylpolyglutamate synthase/dihydrofolate synthase family protein [Terrimicrobiaceae bacterium]